MTLWLVGCGNMGGAMLHRWVAGGLDPRRVTVVDPGRPDVPSGTKVVPAPPLGNGPHALVLAIKPQQLDAVAPLLASTATPLLLSILAGVEEAALATRFPAARAIVRAMPNLPVAIGAGVTALHADRADDAARALAVALAAPLGHVEWIADEGVFDAV
ncbi:NAD(P)-binding domain-containing protein, partial [Sphingomonas bacterium]|uniref:NAD(P)-binding domain-containing protein n=1 Tax=Sphingomonas bacterium TaxID=1895847 RepID=UPI001C2CD322